jgi:hypothetical protein
MVVDCRLLSTPLKLTAVLWRESLQVLVFFSPLFLLVKIESRSWVLFFCAEAISIVITSSVLISSVFRGRRQEQIEVWVNNFASPVLFSWSLFIGFRLIFIGKRSRFSELSEINVLIQLFLSIFVVKDQRAFSFLLLP